MAISLTKISHDIDLRSNGDTHPAVSGHPEYPCLSMESDIPDSNDVSTLGDRQPSVMDPATRTTAVQAPSVHIRNYYLAEGGATWPPCRYGKNILCRMNP